ncbi:hypothetical protein BH10ACT3_BH10ACT3_02860 [soil metagenome]
MTKRKRHHRLIPAPDISVESCVVCFRHTDTAMCFAGDGEFLVSALLTLGVVPEEVAVEMIAQLFGPPELVLAGEMPVRVCATCVARAGAGFPPPTLIEDGAVIPVIGRG